MQLQDEMQKLMQKRMDRRSFLRHVGLGFAVFAGVGTLLKTLASLNGGVRPHHANNYGSNVYGGRPKRAGVHLNT